RNWSTAWPVCVRRSAVAAAEPAPGARPARRRVLACGGIRHLSPAFALPRCLVARSSPLASPPPRVHGPGRVTYGRTSAAAAPAREAAPGGAGSRDQLSVSAVASRQRPIAVTRDSTPSLA